MKKSFQILLPFDRHGHLREVNTLMPEVLIHSLKSFWGMVVMPNTAIPITDYESAVRYREEIKTLSNKYGFGGNFLPVMTGYLTDNTNPENVKSGFLNGAWKAMKLYPHGATTNSDKGVTKLEKIFPVLEMMQKIGMSVLVHPETDVSRSDIPFMDRERVYTEESLFLIHERFPELTISVEHISTREAMEFVEWCPDNVVGTITPQHIMYTHDALFHNGVPPFKPGLYPENMCLPILKTQDDVNYIRNAIMHGERRYKFGAGTDTAPHTQTAKKENCSRCGVFNASHAVEFYTMIFDQEGMLNDEKGIQTFQNFMSVNNLWIYGIKEFPTEMITLVKEDQQIPEIYPGDIRPFKAGQTIPWTMKRELIK